MYILKTRGTFDRFLAHFACKKKPIFICGIVVEQIEIVHSGIKKILVTIGNSLRRQTTGQLMMAADSR